MFCCSIPQEAKRRVRQHTTLKQDFVVWLNTQDPIWSTTTTRETVNKVAFDENPRVRIYISHTYERPKKRRRSSIVSK